MTENNTILGIRQISFAYGKRPALDRVSFSVGSGQIMAILGPNGSGKSTLFKLLSTLVPLQSGDMICKGVDYRAGAAPVRPFLGVVFQSPSLDKKLTVRENLRCHAALYGLSGQERDKRIQAWLERLRVADRAQERVETLSGGLARRVEIAKALLHGPALLILDEPSTGLDPRSRAELWDSLVELRDRDRVTILITTHLMEEAEKSDRTLILDEGRVVADESPEELIRRYPHDVLCIHTHHTEQIARFVSERFGSLAMESKPDHLRVEVGSTEGAGIVAAVMGQFAREIGSVTLSRTSLDEVFFKLTGKSFAQSQEKAA
ncbi:ABC transporter ATP-binding protein [Kamptonema cortianum]|uniref:ABC transporter ATP-binding protein n=1 Tax=Geitlerinema calcuttense NRMC-F 0142 TaxID=2922238 RepID=A0ABT7M1H0_9CYAN|nr:MULTISPECIES: ABC transporter ATP-binding protein [Cyanophyceae]MDK3161791.1 ABC transporter ATP-binding protein [Kamptonema cortianum]MDL5054363.1 ABC transporter ATP-binding protein [Oscillatoria laete-virens NRMC-F 0139]MDL5057914.1 ABC transporter ATP-binding protein [Geitlerinema calcuttense NRMC-F 0142]